MKIYKVKVNGKVYEVQLEEVTETSESIQQSTSTRQTTSTDGHEVKSFIQGTVTDVLVHVNDTVSKGQPLITIEAMKMQNEIVAPIDGTVVQILVKPTDSVENQELLLVIG